MTYADDFIEGGAGSSRAPNYPSAFGIQFTPKVTGILVGIAGLAGAAYLYVTFVQPVVDANNVIIGEIETEKANIRNAEQLKQEFAQAQVALGAAKQQQSSVLGLYASVPNLRTLLLDVNKRLVSRNTNNPDDIEARLTKFAPDPKLSGIINDSSYGATVNNKLYREVFNVELQASFNQTMLFMTDLERLKPLLVVRNLKSQLDTSSDSRVFVAPQNGKLVPVQVQDSSSASQAVVKFDGQGRPVQNPTRMLRTSFQLQALRPLTAEEEKRVQAAAAPAPGTPGAAATPGATPSPSPSPAK